MNNTCVYSQFEKYFVKQEQCKTTISDEEIMNHINTAPIDVDKVINEYFKDIPLYQTGYHKFKKPIVTYSILSGQQFVLNEKFSKSVKFNVSNNDYQNLYLTYKKSNILKKLEEVTKILFDKVPVKKLSVSQPGYLIDFDTFYMQISVDRYEGYRNNLMFNSYRKIDQSISDLFDVVDNLHHTSRFPYI